MKIIPYPKIKKSIHWADTSIKGYIYKDILDTKSFNSLKKLIYNILTKSSKDTFLTHATVFRVNNQKKEIVSHKQNAREQNVIFDLSHTTEWFYQNPHSIKNWASEKVLKEISPRLVSIIKIFLSLPPMIDESDKWLCYRLHINYLEYEKFLPAHLDTDPRLFNTKNLTYPSTYSFTFYLYDHVEGYGGELFTLDGFVYKPISNSAISINGNQIIHGVTQNINPNREPRLAFTMRFAHIDDLFLPGHPDKHLYKK